MSKPIPEDILQTARLVCPPGSVVELRVVKAGRYKTLSGYFDNPEALAEAAAALDGKAHVPTVYVTLNPVNRDLMARSPNKVKAYAEFTSNDNDVVVRHWLLIDTDAKRPAGISSTDAEHQAAHERAQAIEAFLTERGWPEPVRADSGNGAHLLYAVDLPNDADALKLLHGCLQALAARFDDAQVVVDQKMANASRITKFYGTLTRKGEDTPERPHRRSALISVPDLLVSVDIEQLQELATEVAPPERPAAPARGDRVAKEHRGAFDVVDFIHRNHLEVVKEGPWNGGTRWVLAVCPWNPEHTDRSAWIGQHASGAVSAGCQHNSCSGRDWQALKDLFPMPARYDAPAQRLSSSKKKPDVHPSNPDAEVAGDTPAPEAQGVKAFASDLDACLPEMSDEELVKAIGRLGAGVKKAASRLKTLKGRYKRANENGSHEEVAAARDEIRGVQAEHDEMLNQYTKVRALLHLRTYGLDLTDSAYDIDPLWGVIRGKFEPGEPVNPVKLEVVASRPIWPSAMGRDLATGEDWMKVSWYDARGVRMDRWRSAAIVTDTDELGKLSRQGAPVSKMRMMKLTGWLADATNLLEDDRKNERVTSRLGWVVDGEDRRLILPGSDPSITFTGDVWETRGTVEGWAEGVRLLLQLGEAGYPALAALGLCASSPMVRLIGKRNPILGLTCDSSKGKTTIAKYALSVWGDPDELVIAADMSTAKGVQAKSLRYSDLPLLLDELQRRLSENDKKGRDAVADMIYLLANGVERTRANREGGVVGGGHRYGAALYASEVPLLDALPSGAQFRSIELNDEPLPSADIAARLQSITLANKGAIAHLMAEQVGKVEKGIAGIIADMASDLRAEHPELRGDDPFTIATVAMGLGMLKFALGLDVPCDQVKAWLAQKASAARQGTADAAQAAFETLLSAVMGGVWDGSAFFVHNQIVAWNHPEGGLSISPTHPLVKDVLKPFGGDRHATTWATRGWIQRGKRGTQIASRIPNGNPVKAWRVTTLGLSGYTGGYTGESHELLA